MIYQYLSTYQRINIINRSQNVNALSPYLLVLRSPLKLTAEVSPPGLSITVFQGVSYVPL